MTVIKNEINTVEIDQADAQWLDGLPPGEHLKEGVLAEFRRARWSTQRGEVNLLLREADPESAESLLRRYANSIFSSFFPKLLQFYGMLKSRMSDARSEENNRESKGWGRLKSIRINQTHVNHYYFLRHNFLIEYSFIKIIIEGIESKFGYIDFKPTTNQLLKSVNDAADMVGKMRLD
ncbi:MAG: hypothetical protein AAB373_06565 [Patescibacteria group bacterium]